MAPMSLRVLAPPTSDTSETPTLVLQCDSRKYMFNAGEGTTRISAQYRASNSRVEHIFLTRVASETMGGIPGLLMTLADGGRTSVDVYAPPNLLYALATTRLYARRESMRVKPHEIPVTEPHVCFADEHIELQAIPLLPAQHRELYAAQSSDRPSFDPVLQPWNQPHWRPSSLRGADALQWFRCIVQDAWKAEEASTILPDTVSSGNAHGNIPARLATSPARCAYALPPPLVPCIQEGADAGRQAAVMAYICSGHTQRGKFDPARASELGIPPGPEFARLSRGEQVRIIRPVAWSTMDAAQRQEWLRSCRGNSSGKGNNNRSCSGKEASQQDFSRMDVEYVDIRSQDVVGSARAGPVFFYMHVPTLQHLDTLIDDPKIRAAFAPYTWESNKSLMEEQRRTPHMILHAVPLQVWQDERYQAWRRDFGPACHHFVVNRDMCADTLTYTSNAISLLRLSRMDPDVFSVPGYRLEPRVRDPSTLPTRINTHIPLQPRGTPTQLPIIAPVFDKPLHEMQQHATLDDDDDDSKNSASPGSKATWDAYCTMAAQVRQSASVPPRTREAGLADQVELTTLGTGSSAPSKYRNVLSTLVCIPGDGYLVLDAGESTYFQLARRFGPGELGWDGRTGINKVLRELKMIFVSHIHGDHHMGVIRLLLERRRLSPSEPLVLVTNNFTRFYLYEYDLIEQLGLRDGSVLALENEALDWEHGIDPDRLSPRATATVTAARRRSNMKEDGAAAQTERHLATLKRLTNLTGVRTAPVSHRAGHCYGLILTHKCGWKFVFSGDTMPCNSLVQAGKGATLLVHEATMQDDEAELAAAKGHSTIGQACRVARDMKAEHLLLTHFSQRYPKLARLDVGGSTRGTYGENKGVDDREHQDQERDGRTVSQDVPPIGIAFDMMRMTPAQLRRMVAGHRAMSLLLETEPEAVDEPTGPAVSSSSASSLSASLAGAQAEPAAFSPPKTKRARNLYISQTRFNFHYLVLAFTSRNKALRPPSELSVSEGTRRALQSAFGSVGGAVTVDVMYAGLPLDPSVAPDGAVGEAVLRVASEHVDTLASALSSIQGQALATMTGQQEEMRVSVRGTSHNVGALRSNTSRAWIQQQLQMDENKP